MMLSDAEIEDAVEKGEIKIDPFLKKQVQPATKGYSEPYQDSDELGPEDISSVVEGNKMGIASMMDTLQNLTRNVGELSQTVKSAVNRMNLFMWFIGITLIFFGIVLALIGILPLLKTYLLTP